MQSASTHYYVDLDDGGLYVQRRLLTVVLLQVATLGLYSFMWFYQNWDKVHKNTNSAMSPLLRSFLHVFFAYPLFSSIADIVSGMHLSGKYFLRILGLLHPVSMLGIGKVSANYPWVDLILALFFILDIVFVQYKINQINYALSKNKVGYIGVFDFVLLLVIAAEVIFMGIVIDIQG